MKQPKVIKRRAAVARTLCAIGLVTGVVIAGCSADPLDLRPTLGAGNGGSAGGSQTTDIQGSAAGLDGGGGFDEGGMSSEGGGGAKTGGTGGTKTGGTGGTGGTKTGGTGGGGTASTLCGNGTKDSGEECDDSNKLRGDGCSSDCKSSCETCERDVCPTEAIVFQNIYKEAYGMEGDAQQGPAIGTPRAQLLRNLLDCAYRTHCTIAVYNQSSPATAEITLRACACDIPPPVTIPPSPTGVVNDCKDDTKIVKGPCYKEMQAAAEADVANDIFVRMSNRNYAIGQAFHLLKFCDARICGDKCMPEEQAAGVCVGKACPGGQGGTGGTGGGGTAGGGTAGGGTAGGGSSGTGGGGGPGCGNGNVEGNEECEPPNTAACTNDCRVVMSKPCIKVEKKDPTCAPLATACTTSPGVTTPEAQAACYDVARCIFLQRACSAEFPAYACFCGSDASCAGAPEAGPGAPNGPCADVIRAGMGPGATNAQVMARYTDANYPAGAALKRHACLERDPISDCGFPACANPDIPDDTCDHDP